MNRLVSLCAVAATLLPCLCHAQQATTAGSYKLLSNTKVGGEGGFDYVYADSAGRKLYAPRTGASGHISVFDLDTLKPLGEIPGNARGVAVDRKSGHGFASSKPVTMFDAKTLATIKTIDVEGGPDGIMTDNGRIFVLSHASPNVTVIDAASGDIAGTVDLGGEPEQAVSDGKGHLYIDLEDKASIAVVDTNSLKLLTTYPLNDKGGTCAGLAIDVAHNILFSSCRNPQNMVILNAATGAIIDTLPIGAGSDGAVFNPATMEAFSSQGDGTLSVIKETSPTTFTLEQTVTTVPRAKTLTLDTKTNRILLIAAEFGPPPPTQPGGRPARGPMLPGSFAILVVGK